MKVLMDAVLDGISFFVLCVLGFCVMMAIASHFEEISPETYTYIGWYIPVCLGFGKFCGSLLRQTKWYKNKE